MREAAPRSLVPPAGWLGPVTGPYKSLSPGFLLAATLLGAVLRLAALTRQSLWVDEIMTWQMIRPGAGLQFLEQVRDSIQGPLYMAVAWPLVRLADPELMLRLPAALAGTLTVPLFGAVVWRFLDRTGARLAVLLVAINPFLVWYSQEARGYAFVVLFGVVMALAFMRMLERGPNRADGTLFALASAAAVWSNLSGLFLWAALAATLLLRRPAGRRARLAWLAAFAGGLAAAVPWLLQAAGIWAVERLLPGAGSGEALRGATTFDPLAVPYTLFTFFYGFSYGPSLRALHEPDRLEAVRAALPWIVAGALPVLAGGAVGVVRAGRRRWPLVLWVAVVFAAVAVLALRNVKPWNARYLAVAAPWAVALVAAGLTQLPRRAGTVLAVTLCAASLVSLGGYWGAGRYAREDLRGAAAWVAEQADPALPVLVPVVTEVYRFYAGAEAELLDAWGVAPLATADDADAYVDGRLDGRPAAWIVLSRPWTFDPRGLLVPALARRGELLPAAELPGVRIFSWRAAPAAEGAHGG